MTLLETERLARKISELLQSGGNPDLAPKLAGDYAAACHATNLRLQQCEAMIKAGDRQQALQLAETAPNLLDLVTALEFNGTDEWRGYCQHNTLPIADAIDGRSVRTLNECYAQGIATDHPLYAAYRTAVLSRNDEAALKTLQSIARLNPSDANAASELARLDAKVLAARIQHLSDSLAGADPGLLVAEIEAVEGFGFKHKPEGEVWRKAQTIRCDVLLEETARLKNSSQWLEALAKLDFIHRLQNEFNVELAAAELKKLAELELWARGEQEKDRKEREFQSLLASLRARIHQSEEKDTSARYVQLPELRDDYEALHKVWRLLTDFTRPIPEDVSAAFRKRSALLEAEIARRMAIRRRVILAGSFTLLIIGAAILWFAHERMAARNFSRQLQQAIAQRQVHVVDDLLERANHEKTGNPNVIASAETFASKEHALLANFEAAFNQLPQSFSGPPDAGHLTDIANRLTQTRDALNALAPDLKAENEPRLQAFENQWQNYLADSGSAVNGLDEQWVSAAEKLCAELDYRSSLEQTTKQLSSLSDLMQKIKDCEAGFGKNLQLRSDLLERSASVRRKFAAYNAELNKINDGLAAIQKARSVGEFSEGIKLVASSEFSASSAVTAALGIQSLDVNDQGALRILLGATNAATWDYIIKQHPASFIPEAVMPAEQQIFRGLNDDPAVNAIHLKYRLSFDNTGSGTQEWITAGAFDASPGWKQIKAWIPSAAATSAFFEDHDYGYFDGQYKLSPTQPVIDLEQIGVLDETAAFHSVGLDKVLVDGNSYARPLLEVLDSIKNSREGSPLFRAYLFLCLVDLMKLQPDAWGLNFCPAARRNAAQIESIVSGGLNSGDWFVDEKANAYGDALEQFFTSLKSISYMKQAAGLLTLSQLVAKDGLQYVGFVGLNGKPDYIDSSATGEIFGYSADRGQLTLLASKIAARQRFKNKAMPLSPLFALARPGQEYLSAAGVGLSDASFRGALPPLFQETLRP